MFRKLAFLSMLSAIAAACLAQSTQPVGPTAWPLRSWIGLFVQIALFVLALVGICKLATWEKNE